MDQIQLELQLSKNLKYLIRERSISITKLSKATSIPLQTIHGWLSGSQPRKISQLKIMANYFEVSLDSLCFEIKFKQNTGKQHTRYYFTIEVVTTS